MPLKVVIVGAGVAGVTAAAALHQAGHSVTMVEKSQFAGDVGAALNLTPNGCRVLRQLGFDMAKVGGVAMNAMSRVDGTTLEAISQPLPLHGDYFAVHRGDLHSELMRLAEGRVMLQLGAAVAEVDVQAGRVTLANGRELVADLIVGADGVHSVVRKLVLGTLAAEGELSAKSIPEHSGCSAFRFLLPTSLFESGGIAAKHVPLPDHQTMRMYTDPTDPTSRRHMIWYACRNGTLQNFVAIYPDSDPVAHVDLDPVTCKQMLLRIFGHFHPEVLAVLAMATDVRLWPLYTLAPLPRWSTGSAILIGDAAHPMLPFSGQGANQAIEDGGALGFLLAGLPDVTLLPERLALFERVRVKRASRVQMMSRAVAGWEQDVQADVAAYCEENVSMPTNIVERFSHDALFDVYQKCREVL